MDPGLHGNRDDAKTEALAEKRILMADMVALNFFHR